MRLTVRSAASYISQLHWFIFIHSWKLGSHKMNISECVADMNWLKYEDTHTYQL